jgi:hypothetical protein
VEENEEGQSFFCKFFSIFEGDFSNHRRTLVSCPNAEFVITEKKLNEELNITTVESCKSIRIKKMKYTQAGSEE